MKKTQRIHFPQAKLIEEKASHSRTVKQLSKIVTEYMIEYPEHTQSIPTVRRGEDPLVASIRMMVRSMAKKSEDLEVAKQKALDSAQAKSEFLANMSHEVRTPLNGVFGLISFLMETELDDEQKNYLMTIRRCNEHLLNILNDILDFTKMNAQELSLNPREFNLEKLLQDIVLIYSPLATQKNLALDFEIDENIGTLFKGDDIRIKQILSNLVSNSIKFTESGGVKIYVQLPYPDTHPGYLMVSVCDTGQGIDEESIGTIFDPFTQSNSSLTRNHEGTGLGLAICANLAKMMEGEIWVDSKLGEGTSISFTANLEMLAQESQVGHTKEESDRRYDTTPLRSMKEAIPIKVLLVEDNPINRKVASLSLRKLSCNVVEAENGEAALEKASGKDVYDVICMDLSMPMMDGIEATRRIRLLDNANAQAGIIAMTGMAFEEDKDRCLNAGMDDFIAKPFNIGELKDKIATLTGRVALSA